MKFDSSLVGEIVIDNYNREGRIVDIRAAARIFNLALYQEMENDSIIRF